MSTSRFAIGMVSVGVIVLSMGLASAQTYPSKPIRIVTAPAGGGSDWVARLISQELSSRLSQPVIVDNRTSITAIDIVSKAPPDGYSLLVAGESFWLVPLLRKTTYDPMRDFAPISLISRQVNIVAVNPAVPVKSVKELIALAKSKPKTLNYALSAFGGNSHLSAELFKSMAGVDFVAIGYKGAAAAITALISGEVQLLIIDSGVLAPHVKSGKLRALAVTSAEPSELAPGLPTVAATGLPGYEAMSVTCIWASAKTPSEIVNRLNQEVVQMLSKTEMKERFFATGAEIVASSPQQFAAMIKSETARMGKVIKDAGIRLD